jgi:hypothetical protein
VIHLTHLSIFAIVFGAAPALACIAPPQPHDKSVRIVGPDCSVEEHFEGEAGGFYAAKPLDHGDQIISQLLIEGAGCYEDYLYVIADCRTEKVAIFGGDEDYEPGWLQGISETDEYSWTYAKYLNEYGKDRALVLALHGEPVPIDVTPDAGLDAAQRLDMSVIQNGATTGSVRLGKSQVNLGCGCKLYYPDSAGATQ